jgi:hypothetical protein
MVDDRFMFDSNIGKVAEPHDARDLAYMRFTQIRIKDAWVDGELMFSIRHSKLVIYSACFDNGRGSVAVHLLCRIFRGC